MAITYEPEVIVTPSMARQWLDKNADNNRPLKRSKIPGYARDMLAGHWRNDTGETIKFDPDGYLIDGQNRLTAVVLAGVPVTFAVMRNVPREAMIVMDSGTPRSASDTMIIRNVYSRARSSAIVRWTILWDAKLFMGNGGSLNPTHSEVMDRFEREAGAYDAAAKRATDCQNRGLGTGASAGVAYYLFNRIDHERAAGFFDQYVSGANLPDESPILTLRNRMARVRIDRTSRPEQLALFVRAWNAYRENRTLSQLIIVKDGKLNNENFPQPR